MSDADKLMPDLAEAVERKTISQVWLRGQQNPTNVSPSELYYNTELDFGIEERADAAGNVWVSSLFVPQGVRSPMWYIKPDAGGGRYSEEQIVMSGKGWLRIFDVERNLRAEYRLDASNVTNESWPVTVHPGDIFQVEADAEQDPQLQRLGLIGGVMVAAVMRDVAFEINFEVKLA